MGSVFYENTVMPQFPEQTEDKETEVLIIGGGISGILCAYALKERGVGCIVAESGRICSGVTAGTTAKISVQHGLIYGKIADRFGIDGAKTYYDTNTAAKEKYRELASDIPCDYEEGDSYVYSTDDEEKIRREARILGEIGASCEVVTDTELPFPISAAVKIPSQARFNALKFLSGIAVGLEIYENTKVLEFFPWGVTTDKGKIRAKKIIVTTHFPINNKHGSYFLKMYQHRSYVTALRNAGSITGMYVSDRPEGMSFRQYGDFLLIGGGGHRTGKKGGGYAELERFAEKYYPDAEIAYRWATQDCITLDGMPYIGKYSKNTENMYVATGFNKWGMTSSMAAAMILSDIITGQKNKSAELFSPSRSILRPQLLVNAGEALAGLLSFSGKRCPHLACALKWNPEERTWDCPCHGSRFDEDGHLIDNPATGDLPH